MSLPLPVRRGSDGEVATNGHFMSRSLEVNGLGLSDASAPPEPTPPLSLPSPSMAQPGFTFNATDLTLCSGVSPPPLLPVAPEHIENVLTNGTRMIKYPCSASSKPAERLIKVDLNTLEISWESKKKKKPSTKGRTDIWPPYAYVARFNHLSLAPPVDLHAIREIRLGQNTKAFEIHGKRPEFEERAFTVVYVLAGQYKMLNLVAPTKEDATLWISGLHMLMAQTDIESNDPLKLSLNLSTWLRKKWVDADTSKDGKLDLDEITDLMRKLNMRLSKSEIKSTFKSANISKSGLLSFEAFERLYRMLRFRPEVSELFSSLSRTKTSVITLEEFRNFILTSQKNEWSEERCAEVYLKYTGESGQMSLDHFTAFLLSANNSVFRKSHGIVFQDMTQPLTDYFINTSHNTYLLHNQLAGESSVEGYIRALQRGCRCVELDCYDGPNGQPIIYHGRTLVGKLLFRDVIEVIAKYAFVVSPYPLTLSLESHCGLEQQAVMAKILRDVLGDALIHKPLADNEDKLPSPESLKNRIILKGKVLVEGFDDDTDYESTDDEGEQQGQSAILQMANLIEVPSSTTAPVLPRPINKKAMPSPGSCSSPEELEPLTRRTPSDDDTSSGLNRKKSSPKMARKYIIATPLTDLLVYCKGVRFRSFTAAREFFDFDHMCSLSEGKSMSLLQKERNEYIRHTRMFLTRIYPAGIRVNSSNYDPMPHWQVGAQMVAMNFQTFDKGMQLNQAMFAFNGRSGYVLKPARLRGKTDNTPPQPVLLTVKIVSGQQLPKAKDSTSGSNIVDPFVEVEVISGEVDNTRYRTRAINNNGFNPVWKEEFRFSVTDTELAFLRFQVFDSDIKISNDLIGSYAIPIRSLKQGYRHVPLYNRKGDIIRFSSLFVQISIQPLSSGGVSPPATFPRNWILPDSGRYKIEDNSVGASVTEVSNTSNGGIRKLRKRLSIGTVNVVTSDTGAGSPGGASQSVPGSRSSPESPEASSPKQRALSLGARLTTFR
ncbi:1-phosphatidylinositol 4,5-bisphosphate phosphodiesterase delta-4 [Gaertneriomyces sp. JEL0708]|nr:1-phosphatidylinositol 4,5-bisphosphate phosphodiesterase delta-4 [Gaertneriomyces sp. JEL0708]